MRYDLYVGDLEPAIKLDLSNPSGTPLPPGTTAQFVMGQANGTKKVVALATIDDPTIPSAVYQWVAGDTDTPGIYRAVVRLLYPGGAPATYPSDEVLWIVIHPLPASLAGEAELEDELRRLDADPITR